jgi:hypothetical protein
LIYAGYVLSSGWLSSLILKILAAKLLDNIIGISGCLVKLNLTISGNKRRVTASVEISIHGKNNGGWPIRKIGNTDK